MATANTIQLAESLAAHLIATLQQSKSKATGNNAEAALARGRIFQLTGYYAEASESYIAALSQDPNLDEAGARLVAVEISMGHSEQALATAMKLAAKSPSFEFKEASSDQVVSAMTLLGDALTANGRTRDAVEAYRAARASNPKDTFAAGRLVQIFLATGEPKQAQQQAAELAGNSRFAGVERLMSLGAKSEAFLPNLGVDNLRNILRVSMPGRPLVIDNEARVASVTRDSNGWCADVFPDGVA